MEATRYSSASSSDPSGTTPAGLRYKSIDLQPTATSWASGLSTLNIPRLGQAVGCPSGSLGPTNSSSRPTPVGTFFPFIVISPYRPPVTAGGSGVSRMLAERGGRVSPASAFVPALGDGAPPARPRAVLGRSLRATSNAKAPRDAGDEAKGAPAEATAERFRSSADCHALRSCSWSPCEHIEGARTRAIKRGALFRCRDESASFLRQGSRYTLRFPSVGWCSGNKTNQVSDRGQGVVVSCQSSFAALANVAKGLEIAEHALLHCALHEHVENW